MDQLLLDSHRAEWESSAVRADIIDRNVWSIWNPNEVDRLLNRNAHKRWKHSDGLVPGWAVAGIDVGTWERSYKGCQYKPDNPPTGRNGKPIKYLSPSGGSLAPLILDTGEPEYWVDIRQDLGRAIAITEGAKKAGALLSHGEAAISLPGVSTGAKLGRLRKELLQFLQMGRNIRLYFDMDILVKPQVRQALINLGRLLKGKGAIVWVCCWDEAHKGIDDYLTAGGNLERTIAAALTLEEWIEATAGEHDSEIEPCTLAKRFDRARKAIGDRLRFNTLKSKIELDGEPVDLASLRLRLAVEMNIQLPQDDCKAIALYLAQLRAYSPVAEYLEDCAAQYPADSELLDSIAPHYLGADTPLYRAYLRKTLIAAVARAMSPGCKVDTVCILTGAQYAGKSTFWKILASPEWFDDSVGNMSDKDERLKLHAAWFVEWAELEVIFRKKDVSAAKAFITTQVDAIRPPYGAEIVEMKRPSIFVGTTNETEFLSDPTGNRRYWVVPLGIPTVPTDELARERDRIWAAAYHAWKSREPWTLSRELYQESQLSTAEYLSSDPWENLISGYVEHLEGVTTTEILTDCLKLDFAHMDKRAEMRVANLLKAWGWHTQRQRIEGKIRRIWIKPKFDEKVVHGWHRDTKTIDPWEIQRRDNPVTTPRDNPVTTPLLQVEISGLIVECEQRANLIQPISGSSPSPKSDLCKPGKPLDKSMGNSIPDPDCEIQIDGGWHPARWLGEHPNMKICGCSPGLHIFHRCQISLGGGKPQTAIACSDCSYRKLGGDKHGNG